tara:strand:- start:5991 stop:6167 length:177 start_codon:yes stop_codon:yes gene_type:complete
MTNIVEINIKNGLTILLADTPKEYAEINSLSLYNFMEVSKMLKKIIKGRILVIMLGII